jgi:formylglycine-generating enzyme required for sulfatase activity
VRPFWISATEVTQAQWLALMPFNRSKQEGADRPW